jgi:DNA-binding Lrp family transcriptional regulator
MAAVLYVFRTLVDDDIPLNAGCLKPLEVVIPEGCMLRPRYPAAVVAGNVETSQALCDALFGALGAMAAAQGTMNNFTFGNARHQYYETIAGGSGAGPDFDGASAVQTHMTNSRLTDPEVLEASLMSGDYDYYIRIAVRDTRDYERLLRERPNAKGLTVPGMPSGSPGMEVPSGVVQPYEVLLVAKDGSTSVFARHGQ